MMRITPRSAGACWSRPDSPSARAHPERVARVSPGSRLIIKVCRIIMIISSSSNNIVISIVIIIIIIIIYCYYVYCYKLLSGTRLPRPSEHEAPPHAAGQWRCLVLTCALTSHHSSTPHYRIPMISMTQMINLERGIVNLQLALRHIHCKREHGTDHCDSLPASHDALHCATSHKSTQQELCLPAKYHSPCHPRFTEVPTTNIVVK